MARNIFNILTYIAIYWLERSLKLNLTKFDKKIDFNGKGWK